MEDVYVTDWSADSSHLPAPVDQALLDEAKRSLRIDVAQTGFNPALGRIPTVETQSVSLNTTLDFVPAWTARRIPMKCIGLTLPEGMDFLPPKVDTTKSSDGVQLKKIGPAKAEPDLVDGVEAPKKVTRIKPPADALSLQDRLFYLLQPPLESWLAGQELIMPFEPFAYQYEGIAWLFASQAALLADEMGLGKTMQTITAIRLLLRSGQARRIVLICPKPLIPNWQREFKTWAEELPVVTVEGNGARRRMLWTMPGIPVLLANYELMTRDIADIPEDEQPKFDLLVLDEAQRVKNRDSRTAEAARAIKRRRSWALTGTPIENRPEELGAIFEFMEVVPKGASPDLRQLSKLAKKYILRRTKDLVMKDMPPRIDRDADLELTDAQEYAYRVAEKEGIVQLNDLGDSITVQHVFELVMRLKQITNYDPLTGQSAKLERLMADMEEIGASGGKAILFSQWTKTIDWLAPHLKEFNPLIYHGGVPTKHREPILAKFKADPDAHILLMSYGTGAVGLNLQFAGYVFLYDRWWNPAIEDQAINRAHRIGVKNPVIVTRFICKNTIEERIDRVLREKRELFQAILGDGDNENVTLSMNASEIFGLFDLKARHKDGGSKSIGPKPLEKKADAA
ncbi:MAG: DEAD/DEAH box helicase [Planctomycetota bacterium]|nr:MAG: DEAD/DEAH box helicase [Planctomycetota bacterium]